MSKYDPLRRYLADRRTDQAPMTFAEVEQVLGFPLPPSARAHAAWWSNNTGTHVGVRAWRETGWKTSRVDIGGERVVFVRAGEPGFQSEDGAGVLRRADLPEAVRRLVDERTRESGCTFLEAVTGLLAEAAIERRRQILDRFPLTGQRSKIDSTDLVRAERDAQ
jgi:hypothetical protein